MVNGYPYLEINFAPTSLPHRGAELNYPKPGEYPASQPSQQAKASLQSEIGFSPTVNPQN
jgi:hypothetical protein